MQSMMQETMSADANASKSDMMNGHANGANGHVKNGISGGANGATNALYPSDPERYAGRYRVSVEEYKLFRQQGFLVVRNLVSPADIEELRQHTDDLMQGKLPEQGSQMDDLERIGENDGVKMQKLQAPPDHLSPDEKAQFFLRIHMLHRQLPLHERYLLHPRVLDVLEAIIGPDVLALQTMLFLKPPGKPGQGWHQDRFYIPSHPDTLCGAWIAIDDCDELNGAMWMALGSAAEPIYPHSEDSRVKGSFGHRDLAGIAHVDGVSNPDDEQNQLARIADKYTQVLVPAKAGDVVFFNGHVLHRSKKNFSNDRYRRSFVSHYCNARSFTQWKGANAEGSPPDAFGNPAVHPDTGMANGLHILARGDTHLPYALPRFGTPCAATLNPDERRSAREAMSAMADMDSGMMDMMPANPDLKDDD